MSGRWTATGVDGSKAGGAAVVAAGAVAGAAVAAWVAHRARRAVAENPPLGKLLTVDGVRVHCVERGSGSPVVLLHGNLVLLQDFVASGLLDRLAKNHRVIAFDRPGFGHSERPRDRLWTPFAQAALLDSALRQLGVERAAVFGHSMGTMTALALALNHPTAVRSLLLAGGYYYPTLRVDAVLTAPLALPVLGDAMRYTVSALASRAMLRGAVKAMFSPLPVPPSFFIDVQREMIVRPVQLRANAEDAAFMIPVARQLQRRYAELATLPLTLLAGERDGVVDIDAHTKRLHAEMPHSELLSYPGTGHMVHYVAGDDITFAVGN